MVSSSMVPFPGTTADLTWRSEHRPTSRTHCYVKQASKCHISAYAFYKLHLPKWQRISSGSPSSQVKAAYNEGAGSTVPQLAPASPVATPLQEPPRCSALVCPSLWAVLGNPEDWLPRVGTASRIYVLCSSAAHNYMSLSPNGYISHKAYLYALQSRIGLVYERNSI